MALGRRRARVRQADIADRLALSKMAVSKALRDHPDISPATRRRVKEVALQLGYVPDRLARSLSARRSRTLGVVIPKISTLFYAEALAGVQARAAEDGYEIVLSVSEESADREARHVETLLGMRVEGLVVAVSQEPAPLAVYERVRELGVPLVFFDRMFDGHEFSSVMMDDRGAARRAVDALLAEGRKRIAHLAGPAHVNIGRERRSGFEEAMRDAGLAPRPEWIVEGGFGEADGREGLMQILAADELPDALLAVTYPVGFGALDALRDRAPDLEGRLRIAAFGQSVLNRHLRHPFLCVEQPVCEMGRAAVELLLEELREPGLGSRSLVLPAPLAPDEPARLAGQQEDERRS
jgi:LacI family transcriptional regulator